MYSYYKMVLNRQHMSKIIILIIWFHFWTIIFFEKNGNPKKKKKKMATLKKKWKNKSPKVKSDIRNSESERRSYMTNMRHVESGGKNNNFHWLNNVTARVRTLSKRVFLTNKSYDPLFVKRHLHFVIAAFWLIILQNLKVPVIIPPDSLMY